MALFIVGFTLQVLWMVCTAQLTTTPDGEIFIEENQEDILLFNGTYIWSDVSCNMKSVEARTSVPDIKIRTTFLTSPGICTLDVTLLNPIDYEKTTLLTINLIFRKDCSGIETQEAKSKLVIVQNVMDTPPAFTNSTYIVGIPENQLVNTAVLINIQALDADGSDSVSYTVNFVDQQHRMFQVRAQTNPEIMDLYLISSLDFEQQHIHRFTITAIDSVGMNSTCDVVVHIINVQDTPPAFAALQYNGRTREDAKVGSAVLTVSATDGDSVFIQDTWEGTKTNQIYYSIQNGDVGMFGINSSTGEITTVKELDIDSNANVTNGLVVLTILAEELNTSMEPQYGASTATVLALMQIEDANDNRPQFSSHAFIGSIRADAVLGELIAIEGGGYISVFDIDQAPSNNRFSLHIERDGQPWDAFKPNIETQFAYASVMVQLNKNGSILDMGDTHIKFQIVAQEYGNASQNFMPTKSEITVWVKARAVPTTPPEPIINLPLSTADVIVFVVGLLLLLNIGLTIFVCFALRGGRGHPMNVFDRNSKYYVSNRRKSDFENNDNHHKTIHNEGLRDAHVSKLETSQNKITRTDMPTTSIQADINTSITLVPNTVTPTSKSTQSDTSLLQDKDKTTPFYNNNVTASQELGKKTEAPKQLSTNVTTSQMESQSALLNMFNGNEIAKNNVTQLRTSSTQDDSKPKIAETAISGKDQLINGPENHGQGLSIFLQKVQHKLGHGNKRDETLDLQPVNKKSSSLKSSSTESTHINSISSSFSDKNTGDGVPLIKLTRVQFQNNVGGLEAQKNLTSIPVDLSATSKKDKVSDKQNNNQNFTLLPTIQPAKSDSPNKEEDKENKSILSKTILQNSALPSNCESNSAASFYPDRPQITQTDVPPVAIALPYSTGTLNINKEPHLGIVNPVFELFSETDNNQSTTPFVISPASKLSTSNGFGKTNHPQLPSQLPIRAAAKHMASSQGSAKETKVHHDSPLPQTQYKPSPHSLNVVSDPQEYKAAAENMLSIAKESATLNEDNTHIKQCNTLGETFTSF